jgi:hypothetical protein
MNHSTSRPDLEPFNGCREMIPVRESFDAKTPHGPSQVILTARVGTDSVFTCTIKIPLLVERSFRDATA